MYAKELPEMLSRGEDTASARAERKLERVCRRTLLFRDRAGLSDDK